MRIAVDTHLHIYPRHDPGRALGALRTGLSAARADVNVACFTEGRDCRFFEGLRSGAGSLPDGWTMRGGDGLSALLVGPGGFGVWLCAGRQIVTSERVEVLALVTDGDFRDGRPAAETVEAVVASGGLPVLAWAPGKWFFRRGRVVERLLAGFGPDKLALGDSSLRPTLWPTPRIMARARKGGVRVVAGSDPLPVAGDERWAGAYFTLFDGAFDPQRPAASLLKLLKSGRITGFGGRRGGPLETLRRLTAHARAARAGA